MSDDEAWEPPPREEIAEVMSLGLCYYLVNRTKKEWVCLLELTGSCQGPRILEGEAARALAHLVYGPWSGDVVEYISDGGGWHDDAVDVVDDGDDVRFVGINGWKNVTEQTRKILGVWYPPSKWPKVDPDDVGGNVQHGGDDSRATSRL